MESHIPVNIGMIEVTAGKKDLGRVKAGGRTGDKGNAKEGDDKATWNLRIAVCRIIWLPLQIGEADIPRMADMASTETKR